MSADTFSVTEEPEVFRKARSEMKKRDIVRTRARGRDFARDFPWADEETRGVFRGRERPSHELRKEFLPFAGAEKDRVPATAREVMQPSRDQGVAGRRAERGYYCPRVVEEAVHKIRDPLLDGHKLKR